MLRFTCSRCLSKFGSLVGMIDHYHTPECDRIAEMNAYKNACCVDGICVNCVSVYEYERENGLIK